MMKEEAINLLDIRIDETRNALTHFTKVGIMDRQDITLFQNNIVIMETLKYLVLRS